MPVWHASISIIGRSSIHKWKPSERKFAAYAAKELLSGVGIGITKFKLGKLAVHYRRQLHDDEIAGLDPEWLALPAIDME